MRLASRCNTLQCCCVRVLMADPQHSKADSKIVCLRRVVRWSVFASFVFVISVVWGWVLWEDRLVVVFGVDPATPLVLHVDNCQVLLGHVDSTDSLGFVRNHFAEHGNGVARDRAVVAVSMPRVFDSVARESSPGTFHIANSPDHISGSVSCRNNPTDCRVCRVFVLTTALWPEQTVIFANATKVKLGHDGLLPA